MIKVINNNLEEEVYTTECEHCGSELEYTLDDTDLEEDTDNLGFKCPVCGKFHVIEYNNPFQFPESFTHVSNDNHPEVSNEDIQEIIDDCVECMLCDCTVGGAGSYQIGDILIFVSNKDNEVNVYVTKDYYQATDYIN